MRVEVRVQQVRTAEFPQADLAHVGPVTGVGPFVPGDLRPVLADVWAVGALVRFLLPRRFRVLVLAIDIRLRGEGTPVRFGAHEQSTSGCISSKLSRESAVLGGASAATLGAIRQLLSVRFQEVLTLLFGIPPLGH